MVEQYESQWLSVDEFKAFAYARLRVDLPEPFKHEMIASIVNELKQQGLHRVLPDGTEQVQLRVPVTTTRSLSLIHI